MHKCLQSAADPRLYNQTATRGPSAHVLAEKGAGKINKLLSSTRVLASTEREVQQAENGYGASPKQVLSVVLCPSVSCRVLLETNERKVQSHESP